MNKLDVCLINLESFSRSYHMSRLLRDIYPRLDSYTLDYVTFQHLHNTLLCDSVVSWCRIFGSDKEELHWKKIVLDENEFRTHLLSWSGLTFEEFTKYRQSLLVFRNKVASHFDPEYLSNGTTPHFDIANKLANKSYSYFCAFDERYVNRLGRHISLDKYGEKSARHLTIRLENIVGSHLFVQ